MKQLGGRMMRGGRSAPRTGRLSWGMAGLWVFVVMVAGSWGLAAEGDEPGFRVPDGFAVTRYAGDDLARDVYRVTIDARGRVVVTGRDYIKVLHDDSGDGRADRAVRISDFPQIGARGIYFDGDDAIVSAGDGVYRLPMGPDGKLNVAGRERLIEHSGGGGDHTANGLRRGPDGWYYLITGDSAGISEAHASLAGSPIDAPTEGVLLRIAPEGSGSQVVADGFRNPYDLAFSEAGQVLTWDADGERVHHLPWFVPTRLFDVVQGASHGWLEGRSNYWNVPGHFFDHAGPIAELGRGSPTGVAVYRHEAFPERYRGGVFLADWSFGQILFQRVGEGEKVARDRSEAEVFLDAAEGGFAVTALAVGPGGELFASVGGRGTRGAVYRIEYVGGEGGEANEGSEAEAERDALARVLGAPQPLSSWSRARWVPIAERLGREALVAAAGEELPSEQRVRAVEVLVELFGGIDAAEAERLMADVPAGLKARVVWALSRSADTAETRRVLAEMSKHEDGRVARAAWAGWTERPGAIAEDEAGPGYLAGFDHDDARVRLTAMQVARGRGRAHFEANVGWEDADTPRQKLSFLYVRAERWQRTSEGRARLLRRTMEAFEAAEARADVRVDLVRLAQIGLGDIPLPPTAYGYTAAELDDVADELREALAERLVGALGTGGDLLDAELARLAAMLRVGPAGFLDRLSARWGEGTSVPGDIHYLMAASHVPGPRSAAFRERAAEAIVGLQRKLAEAGEEPTRHWPAHVQGMVRRLIDHDAELAGAIVADEDFGLAAHALLAEAMEGADREAAAARLLETAVERSAAAEAALTLELIELLGSLDDEDGRVRALLRRHVDDVAVQGAVIERLSDEPDEADRERLLSALGLMQDSVVKAAAEALAELQPATDGETLGAVVAALHRWSGRSGGEAAAVRAALAGLLDAWSGGAVAVAIEEPVEEPLVAYEPWFAWFAEAHAEVAGLYLPGEAAEGEGEAFERRVAAVDFEAGNAEAGAVIFAARGCMACHTGPARVGPELENMAQRFEAGDLLRLINDPERVLGPDASVTTIVTTEGRTHQGRLIYDSPAVRILRTRGGATVHVPRERTARVEEAREPLMPSGLLEDLDGQSLADLHAYLRRLDGSGESD